MVHWRLRVVDAIEKNCTDNRQVAVTTGHFMFWPEEQEVGSSVYT